MFKEYKEKEVGCVVFKGYKEFLANRWKPVRIQGIQGMQGEIGATGTGVQGIQRGAREIGPTGTGNTGIQGVQGNLGGSGLQGVTEYKEYRVGGGANWFSRIQGAGMWVQGNWCSRFGSGEMGQVGAGIQGIQGGARCNR